MRFIAFLALVLLACSQNNSSPPVDSGTDASGFDSAEQAAYALGAATVPALLQVASVADSFFQFDPTLDPTQTDSANTGLIRAHLAQNLGTTGDGGVACGTLSVSGTTLTASFGPLPGCTLKNGVVLSGTFAVTVTKSGSSLTVTFTFTSATVDGTALSGTASFTTSDGMTLTVNANVTVGTTTISTNNLTVVGGNGAITLSGFVTNTGDANTTLQLSSVVWSSGACYPSAGTLTITKGVLSETVTFNAATATTGVVAVTIVQLMVSATLPPYGKCGGDAGS